MNEQERGGHDQGQPGYGGQAHPYSPGAGQPYQQGWGQQQAWGAPPPGGYGPQPGGQYAGQPYPAQQVPQPRSHHPLRTAAITVGAIALSVAVGLGVGHFVWTPSAPTGVSGNQNFGSIGNQTNPSNTAIDPQAIAKKVSAGIVNINTELGYQGAAAAGTGIVLTADGEVLTNNHVVEGATSIKVTDIGNGQTYPASVLGYDRSHDVAVLKLAGASGLATETLGDSSSVKVGDAVVGLGNAGGAGGAPIPAGGRVTALNQSITASDESNSSSEQLKDLIQVDANIQSGDSGGPLVNAQGQVVGMDTAASAGYQFNGGGRRGHGGLGNGFPGDNSQGDGSQGDSQGDGSQGSSGNEGYAIPVNQAVSIAHQIVGGTGSDTVHIGKSAFLGVTVSDAGQQQQQGGTGSGAAIQQVVPDGAAAKAGLAAGDVITAVDGKTVDSPTTLTTLMDQHHPGDKLTVTVVDQTGQQQNVTVVPAEGPVG
ncbi:PDZ domain-containing protein [Amycolatopsis rubida]|uniref:PDZ domain-containing protein n=1 Tax=Amycolatopsis rubida TaxID=112413 RepID=A0A1I6AZI4_9PSEU|nr:MULTISPECIES: trypsin-like peptidase domain-containing protein [Amycolatopsis]MYW94266.1 PDZ domain-containing protein [Amycolatopsis rubida]NEC59255.1 PDZ domain-containing protein [Amycolatopsis rubida]OAP22574.1 putative serine protease HtrA [Amycolatopsis sp. M39]SFQ74118.1 serine protease, S1-C subfamily, contains C-terminal PDZ domain [Amycolatopsis rubida]